MKEIRALLVGVNQYQTKRVQKAKLPGGKTAIPVPVDADLPSAVRDVSNMKAMLDKVAPKLGFSAASGRVGVGYSRTRRSSILEDLKWLGESAGRGDQLLLYFSGHSSWVRHFVVDPHTELPVPGMDWYELALCPSDTTWKDTFITAVDVYDCVGQALAQGACMEIVLETCSATGVVPKKGQSLRPFGEGTMRQRVFARWDAAEIDQSSHSGPVPPCRGDAPAGLFTHFFCQEILDAKGQIKRRAQHREDIARALELYRVAYQKCCGRPPWPRGGQTPQLSCSDAMEELQVLRSNCRGHQPRLDGKGRFRWDRGAER